MKKLITMLAIFLLIFSAVAVGITHFAISNADKAQKETGIDLYGTYDTNDLFIDEIVQELNEDEEIKIPQTKGLKDTAVQDKINNEMYNRATALIEKFPEISYANYYAYANFANVISISFTVGFDEEPYSESIYFNYSLVDGSELKLEDLFMSDANLIDIIRASIYKQLALYGGYDHETYVHYPNETELYKIVKGYLTKENKLFAFSPSGIYLYPENHFAEVKMLDYADEITIYSKFMTEDSIFTGEYPGFKNIFTCADSNYDYFDVIEYGYKEENLWADLTVGTSYFSYDSPLEGTKREQFDAFRTEMIDSARQEIEKMRETAKANPDKFYIVLSKPDVYLYNHSEYNDGKWHYTYSNVASVSKNLQVFEMPMDLYNSVYRDKIIDTYRYEYFLMRGGAYLDTEADDGAIVTVASEAKLYNFITGEHISALEDVFAPDSNYMETLKELTVSRIMSWLDCSHQRAAELFDEAVFTVEGITVCATFPSVKDLKTSVSFSEFDKASLNVFEEE